MAFLFNGTSDYLTVDSSPITAMPITLFGWFKNEGETTNGINTLITVGQASNTRRWTIFCFNASAMVDTVGALTNGGGTSVKSEVDPATLSIGSWKPCGGVFTSATSRQVRYDGIYGPVETTSVTPTGVNNILIGSRYNPSLGSWFYGSLAELALWDVSLTTEEFVSLEKGISPMKIRPSALRFYLPLMDNPNDIIGGRIMTVNGAIKADDHPRIYR